MWMFLLIVNEPDGFGHPQERFYGPFSTERSARSWADEHVSDDYPRRITTVFYPA